MSIALPRFVGKELLELGKSDSPETPLLENNISSICDAVTRVAAKEIRKSGASLRKAVAPRLSPERQRVSRLELNSTESVVCLSFQKNGNPQRKIEDGESKD
jgi:hypothetical protein